MKLKAPEGVSDPCVAGTIIPPSMAVISNIAAG